MNNINADPRPMPEDKEEDWAIVESDTKGAKIIRPDKVEVIVVCLDEMMSEMLYLTDNYPGLRMKDRRHWKFPGEA